jgi:D-alanine transaminase
MSIVFFNGAFLPKAEVCVSLDDRGFLLADGVYEVVPVYHGRAFRLEEHLLRLQRGLGALRIGLDVEPLASVSERLVAENELQEEEFAIVYLQVTRGAAPRTHAFPPGPVTPTVYGFAKSFARWSAERWAHGATAVTVPDLRWMRADIKSIALLPNVLAQQAAVDAGVEDAILVRDGVALEGAHANLFAVLSDTLVTHPCTNQILPGITRAVVLELAREAGIPMAERPILLEEVRMAEELLLSGTTVEIRPLVRIDGRVVGSGVPGQVTRTLHQAFLDAVA